MTGFFFNINYELSPPAVIERIEEQIQKESIDYVCVADGNVLQRVHRDIEYRKIINGGMFSICDSSWVPLFIKWIYGIKVQQYCGSNIFEEMISRRKYRMFFMGTSDRILIPLKKRLTDLYDPRIAEMQFYELPFCEVDEFDYPAIAEMVNRDKPDIIWVALGAPKQEMFMARLKPYLNRGVMICVGAVFKFYCGVDVKRAPQWVVKCRMEFIYRIFTEPKKQIKRCWMIVRNLPAVLYEGWKSRNEIQPVDKC